MTGETVDPGKISLLKHDGDRRARALRAAFEPSAPKDLLRGFAALLVATAVVISVLFGVGVSVIYRAEMIRDAEVLADSVAEALLAQERDLLLAPAEPGVVAVRLAEEHFAAFDRRMRRYLQPFGIYKIKVYDADARIVYSTDVPLIGRADPDNPLLRQVLASGATLSEIKRRGQVADLGGGVRFDVDVVETYLPIRHDSRVIGSFEVYLDLGRQYEQLDRSVAVSVVAGVLVVLVAFAVLFAFARHGAARYALVLSEFAHRDATDPLTGALNHHVLLEKTEALRQRLGDGEGQRGAICLALIEVDQFPALVDAAAPVTVDAALRGVSSAIHEQMRDDELLGRHRGGTFLAVLARPDLSDAVLFGERIRRAVSGTATPGGGRSVTASVGITRCLPADDVATAVRRAEDALRRAKSDGRDCVRAA
ncbi:diguanylate cyclase domain-containing protein [Azospirillum sp.]|uniref:GGDEF domain-containing protein n=1 Tax=Azospirillum sp. TaxID=34012 RepID=UPI003D7415B4